MGFERTTCRGVLKAILGNNVYIITHELTVKPTAGELFGNHDSGGSIDAELSAIKTKLTAAWVLAGWLISAADFSLLSAAWRQIQPVVAALSQPLPRVSPLQAVGT